MVDERNCCCRFRERPAVEMGSIVIDASRSRNTVSEAGRVIVCRPKRKTRSFLQAKTLSPLGGGQALLLLQSEVVVDDAGDFHRLS